MKPKYMQPKDSFTVSQDVAGIWGEIDGKKFQWQEAPLSFKTRFAASLSKRAALAKGLGRSKPIKDWREHSTPAWSGIFGEMFGWGPAHHNLKGFYTQGESENCMPMLLIDNRSGYSGRPRYFAVPAHVISNNIRQLNQMPNLGSEVELIEKETHWANMRVSRIIALFDRNRIVWLEGKNKGVVKKMHPSLYLCPLGPKPKSVEYLTKDPRAVAVEKAGREAESDQTRKLNEELEAAYTKTPRSTAPELEGEFENVEVNDYQLAVLNHLAHFKYAVSNEALRRHFELNRMTGARRVIKKLITKGLAYEDENGVEITQRGLSKANVFASSL